MLNSLSIAGMQILSKSEQRMVVGGAVEGSCGVNFWYADGTKAETRIRGISKSEAQDYIGLFNTNFDDVQCMSGYTRATWCCASC